MKAAVLRRNPGMNIDEDRRNAFENATCQDARLRDDHDFWAKTLQNFDSPIIIGGRNMNDAGVDRGHIQPFADENDLLLPIESTAYGFSDHAKAKLANNGEQAQAADATA
jgi:hypothetical protein